MIQQKQLKDSLKIKPSQLFFCICMLIISVSNADVIYNQPGQTITLSGSYVFKENVVVESGTKLVITGSIEMGSLLKFIVKKGATVILEGGTIISGARAWAGFEVEGGGDAEPNHPSIGNVLSGNYTGKHGVLILKGGKVALAEDAVKAYNGGIVIADGTIFDFCVNSIFISQWKYPSFVYQISNCTFSSNNYISPNGFSAGTQKYIEIDGIEIITIRKCNFMKSHSIYTAVYARNKSSMSISNCKFEGIGFGIFDDEFVDTKYTTRITNNLFADCLSKAMLMIGVNRLSITNNNFISNKKGGDYPNIVVAIQSCRGYNMHGNKFESTIADDNHTGLNIYNSGSTGITVYQNSFTNLNNAFLSETDNTGLQLQCNGFDKNITNDWEVFSAAGMPTQGTSFSPAGNTFSQTCGAGLDLDNSLGKYTNINLMYYYDSRDKSRPKCDNYVNKQMVTEPLVCKKFEKGIDLLLPMIPRNKAIMAKQETTETEVEYLDKENQFIISRIVQEYINTETGEGEIDPEGIYKAITFLEEENSNYTRVLLVPLYIHTQQYDKAQDVLNHIEIANEEANAFVAYYQVILQLEKDQRYDDITTNELEIVNAIAGGKTVYAAQAQNLLNKLLPQNNDFTSVRLFNTNPKGLINVYPNPASNLVNITMQADSNSQYTFKLFDITGRLVQQKQLLNSENTVNTAELKSGLYTILVYQNQQLVHTQKLTIFK